MEYRLPYYMAYPMPFEYDDEKQEQRDVDYIKSMYPMTAKRLLPFVEEELDRMEYEGSVIYDEYPDQLQMRLMGNRIYDRVKDQNWANEMEMPLQQETRRQDREDGLRDLLQILLYHELYQRRNRRRRNRRRYY